MMKSSIAIGLLMVAASATASSLPSSSLARLCSGDRYAGKFECEVPSISELNTIEADTLALKAQILPKLGKNISLFINELKSAPDFYETESKNPKNSEESSTILKDLSYQLSELIPKIEGDGEELVSYTGRRLDSLVDLIRNTKIEVNDFNKADTLSANAEMIETFKRAKRSKINRLLENILFDTSILGSEERILESRPSTSWKGQSEFFSRYIDNGKEKCFGYSLYIKMFKNTKAAMFLFANEVGGVRKPIQFSCSTHVVGKASVKYNAKKHKMSLSFIDRPKMSINLEGKLRRHTDSASISEINTAVGFEMIK